MATNTNKKSLEATFSELLNKIQKLTASHMRRLEELVEQGVYIPGSDPDDNGEINLPSGKRDETRKSPTKKPVEDQALGDILNGPTDDDDGFDDDAVDGDIADNVEVPADDGQSEIPPEGQAVRQMESTEDPEVKNAQVADDKVSEVPVKQLEDFDDGFSMDIFDDDGTICEDDEGNEECLVVSLNGLHSDGDIGGIDSFDTTIAPIYDNDGNIDQMALRDAALKIASEVLDAKITDADTVVLQTKQDAAKKLHDAERNLAFLPANYYSEENTPTTVLFPCGTTSQLAQIIGNNPILDPVPSYVGNASDTVMPPVCIGSAQNAEWAPYVCLVKRPALLGGFSLSIASMCDADLGEDKHAKALRNKGIKELHNDLQTFAKYHDGVVINRPKAGTDADVDAEDENCICLYKSVPKEEPDDDFFPYDGLVESDGAESEIDADDSGNEDATSDSFTPNTPDTPEAVTTNIERIKNLPDDADPKAEAAKAQEKEKEAQAAKDAAISGGEKRYADAEKKISDTGERHAEAINQASAEIMENPEVKNGGDLKDIPLTDDAAMEFLDKSGSSEVKESDDDFEDDSDIVPDDETSMAPDKETDIIIVELPFPGFGDGNGENGIFEYVIKKVLAFDGKVYRKIVSRSIVDRVTGQKAMIDAVCNDEEIFGDVCDTIADTWANALNEFIQEDAFGFWGPVDIGAKGFDDRVYATMDADYAESRNIHSTADGDVVPAEVLLRNVFDARTTQNLFDDVEAETGFLDAAADAVERMLLNDRYDDLVKALND